MLEPILNSADVRARNAEERLDALRRDASAQQPARGFMDALQAPGLSVIAEIKRASPSAGNINEDLDPVSLAVAYEVGGADAVSILTEPDFFGGSLEDLIAVREAISLPVLRKDFTRNEAQIWEARAAGADAVLLIVATLSKTDLEAFVTLSEDVGIAALVETHTAEEIDRALCAGATMIGVNNRNLATFHTDLAVAEQLAARVPGDIVSIAESGVSSVAGARRMRASRYDAILVGEALVRAPDPAAFVASLKDAR